MKPGKDTTQSIPTLSSLATFSPSCCSTDSSCMATDNQHRQEPGCNGDGTATSEDKMWKNVGKMIDSAN